MSEASWPVVLFDLDGTLADTIGVIIESYQHTFRAVSDRDVSAAEARTWIGQTLTTTFEREDPPNAAELERVYRAYMAENISKATGYPGMVELLVKLNESGVNPGVVTSKRLAMSIETVRLVGIKELVNLVVTMEDTDQHKPHPDPLLRAFEKLNVEPEDCVYIGDAVWDIRAAKAAGIPAIAVTWGAGERADLEAAKPEFICDDVNELERILLFG